MTGPNAFCTRQARIPYGLLTRKASDHETVKIEVRAVRILFGPFLQTGWRGTPAFVRIQLALSDPAGVVSGLRLAPRMLLTGCGLITVAVLATRKLARRVTNDVGADSLLLEAALIGLVLTILAGVTAVAAGVFEYS